MAAWRGRDPALKCASVAEFVAYLRALRFTAWRPSGMVVHNTAAPTLQQWWYGGTPPAKRLENIKDYYQGLGWSAGPHAFVDGQSIWVFTDFNVKGVHSPSWNGTRLGVEMVGDYDVESDESGMGEQVMKMTVALFGECCSFFGWEPNGEIIRLHKEDPATDHACPGKFIVKTEFLDDVSVYMGAGGDHSPDPPAPFPPMQGVVVNVPDGDTLNIRAEPTTSAAVIGTAVNGDKVLVVGEEYNGPTRWFRIQFGEGSGDGVEVFGWVSAKYVQKQGDTPPAVQWRTNITATEFSGSGDPQSSAYPPHAVIDPRVPGVALPYKWRTGPRPIIIVEGPLGAHECNVVDVGPWNIHDPTYVLEGKRPMVEQQFASTTPAQNGQVPTNDAAIDLTPAAADAVGINGKGKVRWRMKT